MVVMAFNTTGMSRFLWFLTGFRVLQILLTLILFFTVVIFKTSPSVTINCELYENQGWDLAAYECLNETQVESQNHRIVYDVSFPFSEVNVPSITSCTNNTITNVRVPTGYGSHVNLFIWTVILSVVFASVSIYVYVKHQYYYNSSIHVIVDQLFSSFVALLAMWNYTWSRWKNGYSYDSCGFFNLEQDCLSFDSFNTDNLPACHSPDTSAHCSKIRVYCSTNSYDDKSAIQVIMTLALTWAMSWVIISSILTVRWPFMRGYIFPAFANFFYKISSKRFKESNLDNRRSKTETEPTHTVIFTNVDKEVDLLADGC